MKENGMDYTRYRKSLQDCQLLSKMDDATFTSLISLFNEEKWPKNTCFVNEDKFLCKFYIILSGRVKMYQLHEFSCKEVTLFLLTKGDFIDLFCLLDGSRHMAYYESLDEVKVLAVPMKNLHEWLQKHPQYYINLLSYAGKQLRMLEDYIADVIFTDISTRLLKLLISNVNKSSNNLELINDLSNKEIAYLIGSTRAVVNRHIQKLKQNGSLHASRENLQINNLPLLIKMLENKK
ncbi:Crp/Fnr family transcriptional regulator [Salegentibacter sp. F188]|uniref:Crp/Fnr family transcriptional regulator n=1 Tax=Autumnicola patrickiae TaxID=3075591 RepID=A0ABU3E270_9FLAO|nr:Crp/Fnr family transcriptional regulator [Salegentibacter sp. F188]MDT0690099.1 Crp/Fnr family transcriptional regulator [Salegentibacter sp. F188]